jgi:hypothetical protein
MLRVNVVTAFNFYRFVINTLEGRQGFEIAQLIKTLVPTEATLTKLSLVSCNSADCTAGIKNMVIDVKELFNKSLIVKGYQGTVNANDNGKVIIVANGKLGMAPSDIDSLKQKADELDQQLGLSLFVFVAGFSLFLLFFFDGLFFGFFCLCFLFVCFGVYFFFFF